jgi:outer membrane protein TolC
MTRHAHYRIIAAIIALATGAADAAAQGREVAQAEPGPAPAAPATAPAPTLQATLEAMLGRSGGLTADAVGKRAAATSFDVRARLDELDAASAEVDSALINYFPRLELTGRYTRLSDISATSLGTLLAGPASGNVTAFNQLVPVPLSFPVLLNQYTLQASLSVPLSDYLLRIPQTYAAASHSERAAALSADATKLKVATDGKALYYSWVRAKLQMVVADQALEQARGHLVDVKHAFDAGTASKADVLRLESQVAQSELLAEKSHNLAELYDTQIRVAMHDTSNAPYEIAERIDEGAVPLRGSDIGLSALWTEAAERRLEVRSLTETADSYHEQAKGARAGYWPRLSAFGDAVYANPNSRFFPPQDEFNGTWDAGVQLTIVPNDMAKAAPTSRSLQARASEAVSQRELLLDGVRNEVTQARQARREAEVSIDTTGRGLISAEESYRVRRSLFQHGRATAIELTDAETDLTRARLDAINARIDLRIATVRLEHALGRDVSASPR